jgi:hypothetical protein
MPLVNEEHVVDKSPKYVHRHPRGDRDLESVAEDFGISSGLASELGEYEIERRTTMDSSYGTYTFGKRFVSLPVGLQVKMMVVIGLLILRMQWRQLVAHTPPFSITLMRG